jgi:hypothetical protein
MSGQDLIFSVLVPDLDNLPYKVVLCTSGLSSGQTFCLKYLVKSSHEYMKNCEDHHETYWMNLRLLLVKWDGWECQ